MEFTELREQGVWGEATHTREMCACARFLKSGNEGYSKENRQNRDSEKVDHELPFHSLFFFFEYLLKRSANTLSIF